MVECLQCRRNSNNNESVQSRHEMWRGGRGDGEEELKTTFISRPQPSASSFTFGRRRGRVEVEDWTLGLRLGYEHSLQVSSNQASRLRSRSASIRFICGYRLR